MTDDKGIPPFVGAGVFRAALDFEHAIAELRTAGSLPGISVEELRAGIERLYTAMKAQPSAIPPRPEAWAVGRLGRMAFYVLSQNDAAAIAINRLGREPHTYDVAHAGDHCYANVVKDYGEGNGVNLQVCLDGPDHHWVFHAKHDNMATPGTYMTAIEYSSLSARRANAGLPPLPTPYAVDDQRERMDMPPLVEGLDIPERSRHIRIPPRDIPPRDIPLHHSPNPPRDIPPRYSPDRPRDIPTESSEQ